MVLCFLLGGFALISYLFQVYSAVWRTDFIPAITGERRNDSMPAPSRELGGGNISEEDNISRFDRRNPAFASPFSLLVSPSSVTLLFMSLISLLAGFSIWNLVREKEIEHTKETILDVFLLPEEKTVLDELKKHGGALPQNEIVRSTGFSRVKIHRIVKGLEKKSLILKQQYGMTNKIVLKK